MFSFAWTTEPGAVTRQALVAGRSGFRLWIPSSARRVGFHSPQKSWEAEGGDTRMAQPASSLNRGNTKRCPLQSQSPTTLDLRPNRIGGERIRKNALDKAQLVGASSLERHFSRPWAAYLPVQMLVRGIDVCYIRSAGTSGRMTKGSVIQKSTPGGPSRRPCRTL